MSRFIGNENNSYSQPLINHLRTVHVFMKCFLLFCAAGDAVWANRWQCLYFGFPVSFLSSAGICCCLGQCDSEAEVKGYFVLL